ncbi:MAG: peptidyl-prolyl cis-trans isomerase [Lachnospiraceae bacterium]|nr:peptidyl-prolyl cis-trans isomerase [Lachnospiraceae bacterium]
MKKKRLVPLLLAAVVGAAALTGCGSTIDGEKTGATLNGEKISLGFMNFMARYQQAVYDGQFSAMFGTGMWSQDLFNDGTDMETSVKKNVTENIEILYLLEDHMEDYKVEITEEEQQKIKETAEKFMEDNTDAAIKQMGAAQEYVEQMLRLNTIQAKMRKAMDAEVDTKVSDEEAAQKTISYLEVKNNSTTDDEGKEKEYTEEEKAELKKKLETFASGLKVSSAEEFKEAAEKESYTVSQKSYGDDEESLDKALLEAANKLKEGEISKVVTGDSSYFLVRMDSTFDKEATEKKKDEIVEQRKNDHYKEVCDSYKKDVKYKVNEKEWAKVTFEDLFTIKQAESENTDEQTDAQDNADDKDSADDENNADKQTDDKDSADDENNADKQTDDKDGADENHQDAGEDDKAEEDGAEE